MTIYEVVDNKRDYMDLLFLADEQEDMIEKYLDNKKCSWSRKDFIYEYRYFRL